MLLAVTVVDAPAETAALDADAATAQCFSISAEIAVRKSGKLILASSLAIMPEATTHQIALLLMVQPDMRMGTPADRALEKYCLQVSEDATMEAFTSARIGLEIVAARVQSFA